DITPLPKTILSAITFPITLSLDRTVYLSYYSRYSRFCYFDHFFCPYLRIHWTDFAPLKDNIVGNKMSYNIGHHHFFCICHISRDFLKKPLRHLNLTTFLPITPDPMGRFCSSSNKLKSKSFKKRFIKIGSDLLELS